ncbi:MAG: hypothetical protein N2167_08595 [Flavobacteriales bacterium]|nr:hypothetical protein [Flavobacteriales bacterium]
MKKWKIIFVFIPLLMMMIHGFVPHTHANSSHSLICDDDVSLTHRFFDLISVDIGVNHLQDYLVNHPQSIDQPVQLFIFYFLSSFIVALHADFLFGLNSEEKDTPLHSLLVVGDVSRRGPPMV